MSKDKALHTDKDKQESESMIEKVVRAVFGSGGAHQAGDKLSARERKLKAAEKKAGI